MKHSVIKFKNLSLALIELGPFVRNGAHLIHGKPFKKFGEIRSRELLANWLICAALNSDYADQERYAFTSDPVGGDGIIYDSLSEHVWKTEHVMAFRAPRDEIFDVQAAIINSIRKKQNKGGSAYAKGKTLVIFIEGKSEDEWFPNRVAKNIPDNDFTCIWTVGLHRFHEECYQYGVSLLELDKGNAPTWLIKIDKEFHTWRVTRIQ